MPSDRKKLALLALGANLAATPQDNAAVLTRALDLIGAALGAPRVSRFWQSPAWPPGSGPDFVNACAVVALPPEASAQGVLAVLHGIEAQLGRQRRLRWGPRAIDLDLLGLGNALVPDAQTVRHWMDLPPPQQAQLAPEGLVLPHPRLHERAFVLWPLAEVAPDWRHPLLGRSVAEMAAALPPQAAEGLTPL